ncbi:MAG: aspartate aminotransferase family protein [Chloroflexota bacterium]
MTSTESRYDAYRKPASHSEQLHHRATKVLPGGNTRTTVHLDPYPAYAVRGQGAKIVDAEGQERLDFLNNYTSLMHGHANKHINAAVIEQLEDGTAFAMPTEHEIKLAELLAERIPSVEHVRFTNSGTEAVMTAIHAARAYTGRPMIAKFEGSYHGSYDFAAVSTAAPREVWDAEDPPSIGYAAGTPSGVTDFVKVLRYNDLEMLERKLTRHRHEIAAVLIDPMPWRMGLIPIHPTFVRRLREMTERFGIVLIFDEVISLRASHHGAQGLIDVTPDLTTMAKIIGGGFPVGAVGGKAEIMAVFDPRGGKPKVPHGGTFSANPITMVAGYTSMSMLTEEESARMDALGAYIREGIAEALDGARIPGQVTGAGSLFGIHLHDRPLTDYRSWEGSSEQGRRRTALFEALVDRGVVLAPALTGCLSTPMTEDDANTLIDAMSVALRDL